MLVPGITYACNDCWSNVNWNQTRREASGMRYLEHWLDGVQKRWDSSDCNYNNRCPHHYYNKTKNYYSDDRRNNVNVYQNQEVVGRFKSVTMEQNVKVYVNGELTSSEQKLSAGWTGDGASQTQQVVVRGY